MLGGGDADQHMLLADGERWRQPQSENVDIIYVIDKGIVVEEGDHDSLIKKDGLYSFLFKTQFPESDVEKK